MKHKLTIIPLLALLATCGSSQEGPRAWHKQATPFVASISQEGITGDESSLLDAGSHQINVGPNTITYTPLASSDAVPSGGKVYQHYRMTFDISDVPLCADRPGWNEPVSDQDYKSPGRDGNPDCLLQVFLFADKAGGYKLNTITDSVKHGRNSIDFNYESGVDFRLSFMMAGGRGVTFKPATGEITKVNKSFEEMTRQTPVPEATKK